MKKNTETRDRIRQSAFLLFQKYGYTRTTTRMIAKQAHVNESTVFNIFGNKANLFHEIYYTQPPLLSQMPLEDLTSGKDLRHDIYLLIHGYMFLQIQTFPMYRFSMPLIDAVNEDLHTRSFARIERMMCQFSSYLKYLEAIGTVKHYDYDALTSMIFSVFLVKSFDLITQMPTEDNPNVSYDEKGLQCFAKTYTEWIYNTIVCQNHEEE